MTACYSHITQQTPYDSILNRGFRNRTAKKSYRHRAVTARPLYCSRMSIVRCPYGPRTVAVRYFVHRMVSVHKLHGAFRWPYEDCTAPVHALYDFKEHWLRNRTGTCGHRTAIIPYPHGHRAVAVRLQISAKNRTVAVNFS